jgi:hypothetical protein
MKIVIYPDIVKQLSFVGDMSANIPDENVTAHDFLIDAQKFINGIVCCLFTWDMNTDVYHMFMQCI